ncbi:hypothetical protein M23134_02620 [Microscilla marina ATCC 23134]|uniref:LamG-like jellyroll fold domain-containing protein n=1 Tax=Microscilla marina ATCC 23134 TaxID=313606 RepID=A1ZNR2_MICM2|nr:hypothetical protein M23134_02620 [Microscilla marina ATCC 23134]
MLLFAWLSIAGYSNAQAQEYGILRMNGSKYATHFNTGIDLQQALSQGTAGQATIEFWVRSTYDANYWELTDMSGNSSSLTLKTLSNNRLQFKLGSTNKIIDISSTGVTNNLWHHVAMSFQAGVVRLYLNGNKVGEFVATMPTLTHRYLYFYRLANNSKLLEIAEIRAWNRTRSNNEIARDHWRSFAKMSTSELNDLKSNQGLHALLGEHSTASTAAATINSQLEVLHWGDLLDANRRGTGVHKYNTQTLMEVRNDIEHPILKNQNVFLSATKGTHTNTVVLSWPHIDGVNSYAVQINGTPIGSLASGTTAPGDLLTFDVAAQSSLSNVIVPGQVALYTVVAQGVDATGSDHGFVFHNGTLSGKIQSSSQVGTPNVAVTMGNPTLPGSALQLNNSSAPLIVNNADVFRNAGIAQDFMVEFWYKGSAGGNNTVFKTGNVEIQMLSTGAIRALHGNGSEYIRLNTNAVTDNNWHHYAIVFAQTGGRIYVDQGKTVGTGSAAILTAQATNATTYTHNGIGSVSSFEINAATGSAYSLDELRIWAVNRENVNIDGNERPETDDELNARLDAQVHKHWAYMISGNNTAYNDLLLYYRFDLLKSDNTSQEVYNQAEDTQGGYTATSSANLNDTDVPVLKYVAYTNSGGEYTMERINFGNGSLALQVEPIKTNHTFNPTYQNITLQTSNNHDREDIDFTDESNFNVSGNVYYHEGGVEYPVPIDQTFEFASGSNPSASNYQTIYDGSSTPVGTDAFGQYNLSLPIGLQHFRVANPLRNRTFGAQSLQFDGENDYVKSANAWSTSTRSITWSGFVKRGDFSGTTVPTLQTILQAGNIRVVLRDNAYLALYQNNTSLAEVAFGGSTDWQFFAFTYNASSQQLLLYADASLQATASATVTPDALGGHIYLGAKDGSSEYFKGHLHLIEQRSEAYGLSNLADLKAGNYIAGDEALLVASFSFDENLAGSEVLRLVSKTTDSQDLALNRLVDPSDESTMPAFSTTTINPYVRQYKYEYAAQGNYAQTEQQVWNVTEPASSINFYNHTRYGITGNITIPCNNNIGLWDVTITRTDVQQPAYQKTFTASTTPSAADIFNSEGTVFTVEGLLPGIYKVELTNQDDNSIVKTEFGVDITQGWNTMNVAYNSPLQVAAKVIKVLDEDNTFQDLATNQYCSSNDHYTLEQQTQYQVALEFYEEYGSSKCYKSGTNYYVSGDLPQYHGKDDVVGSSPDAPFTSTSGQDTVVIWANYPNFVGEHTRSLRVNVTDQNTSTSLTAWVTGTVQDENQNFTLTYPSIKQVLYDPPGDGSSVTWAKGSEINYQTSFGDNQHIKSATKFSYGYSKETYIGGIGALDKAVEIELEQGGEGTFEFTSGGETTNSYSLTFNQAISTPSGVIPLPGAQSDMFIGNAEVVYMGSGKSITVSGCTATLTTEDATIATAPGVPFYYTRWAIENSVIPRLDDLITTLRAQLSNSNAEDEGQWDSLSDDDKERVTSIEEYDIQRKMWQSHLEKTLQNRQAVFGGSNNEAFKMKNAAGNESLPKSLAFSGSIDVNYEIGGNKSTSETREFSESLDLTTHYQNFINIGFGVVNVEGSIETGFGFTQSYGGGSSDSKSFELNLSDDDVEDQFNVLIRKDPLYPTPIIVAKAGQSMCPVEKNTVARIGAQLTVTNTTAWADLDGTAIFEVQMSNVQPLNEPVNAGFAKNLRVRIPINHLPTGIEMKVENLADAVLSSDGYSYPLEPGETKTIRIEAYRRGDDAPVSFSNIPLVLETDCGDPFDYYGGERTIIDFDDATGEPIYSDDKVIGDDKAAVVYNSDDTEYVRVRDVVRLNANFHAPCAGSMEVVAPANNWVVNSTSDNQLDFKFKPVTPHSTFAKVRIEFALENSNEPQFIKDVALAELGNADAQDYYSYTLHTDAIGADQAYRVRIIPVCGNEAEAWQTNTPSDWISGNIQRATPTIVSVTPLDGSTTSGALATATYNKALNANGVNPLSVSLRGILGGVAYTPKSAWFDQTNDQVTIPDQSVLDLDGSYTVEFWAKPNKTHSSVANTPIITKGSNIAISFAQGNKIYAGQSDALTDQSLDTDGWTHVAVVYIKGDSYNTLKIYLNGVLAKSTFSGVSNFTVNNSDLIIAQPNGSEGFKGGLDEIRIWNKALPEGVIRTNMHQRLIGTEDGLQAYYVLDDIAPAGEAIRDFTGKTSGTTQTGVTYVEKDQAAPLHLETIIHDIPVEVTTSADQTQVIIQPVATYAAELLEGALLTVNITDDRVTDAYGNPATGKSWTFRVDGNHVAWAPANHTLSQTAGSSGSFSASLVSSNASELTYEFTEVPMWLTADNPASQSNGKYVLPSGHTHPVTFTTAAWLSAGTYIGQVKAKVTQGATLLGYETLDVKVIVNCDETHLTLNPSDFFVSIAANFTLEKSGVPYTDAIGKTLLVRNNTGTLIGKGTVAQVGNEAKASLNIYSHDPHGNYTVYLWEATACQETPIGTGSFSNGNTVTQTLDADYQGKVQYSLKFNTAGIYWVSFRVSDVQDGTTLSLSNIQGFETGDIIIKHDESYIRADLNGELDITQSYKVEVRAPRTLQITGYSANTSHPIALAANPGYNDFRTDYNPLGYTRTDAISVAQAMARLNPDPTVGDVIIGQQGNAVYTQLSDNSTAWVGSLTHMIPNQGYAIKVANASTLNYSSVSTANVRTSSLVTAPVKTVMTDAQRLQLQVNPHAFARSSYLTGVLETQETLKNEQAYMVVAFVGNEVRGIAIPQQIEDKRYYFLTAYTHTATENLRFELVERHSGQRLPLDNSLKVQAAALEGSIAQPYVFRLSQEAQATQPTTTGLQLFQNTPNPVSGGFTHIGYRLPEAGQVRLSVHNAQGQEVAVLAEATQTAGQHSVRWDVPSGLAQGVYFYTLSTAQGTLTKRLVIQ